MEMIYEKLFWLIGLFLGLASVAFSNSCENLMLRNIALGKDTNQSSTRPDDIGLEFRSDLAVDGNISTYSQTNNTKWWWQVDLGYTQLINKIVITFGPKTPSISVTDFQIEHGLYVNNMTQISSATSASTASRRREFIFPKVLAKYVQVRSQIPLQLAEVEVYSENLTPDKTDHMLFTPSYTSEWKIIKSNHTTESEVFFYHSLNEFPVKVVTDILVEDAGVEYYFTDIGAPETDDDEGEFQIIGGVACLYDTNVVYLYAIKCGTQPCYTEAFSVIYTGTAPHWTGANITRFFTEAKVRVRVWREIDFPKPSFESDWINVDVNDVNLVYFETPHNIGAVPDIVIVQSKLFDYERNRPVIFECKGSRSKKFGTDYSPITGCTFGFSDTSIRIWVPRYQEKMRGLLLYRGDGYGLTEKFIKKLNGNVKLKAWKTDTKIYEYTIDDVTNLNTYELPFDIIPEYHFPSVKVIVNEGANKDFHFYGVGSTSNDGTYADFGKTAGLIYAFSQNKVLFWIPGLDHMNGSIFGIGGLWGGGMKAQDTNNVTIKITIWNIFEKVTLNCYDSEIYHGKLTGDTSPTTSPSNGSYIFQTKVTLECEEGYSAIDGLTSTICNRSCVLETMINCKGNPCDSLNLAVDNASFIADDPTTGNNVTYTCDYGHNHTAGNMVRICQANGTWSGVAPNCSRVECSVAALAAKNAAFNYTGIYLGDKVDYKCTNNTNLISGDLHRVCQLSGNWSGNPPHCEDCPCKCVPANEDLQSLIEQLKKELTVDKKETSNFKRKFISVADDRPSSQTIGCMGIVFLSVLGVLFIAIDIPNIIPQIRLGFENLTSRCRNNP